MGARAYSYERIRYNVRDKTTTVEIVLFKNSVDAVKPHNRDGSIDLKRAVEAIAEWNNTKYIGRGGIEYHYKLHHYTNGEKE